MDDAGEDSCYNGGQALRKCPALGRMTLLRLWWCAARAVPDSWKLAYVYVGLDGHCDLVRIMHMNLRY
jgi:hypothetical protein